MRLIDVHDKLESADFSECIDSMEIMAVIDTEPTAYDPDKVVEQLEAYSNADEAEQAGTIPVIELEDAIKIVKAGGVDEL